MDRLRSLPDVDTHRKVLALSILHTTDHPPSRVFTPVFVTLLAVGLLLTLSAFMS